MYNNDTNITLEQFIALETTLEETARRSNRLNLTRDTLLGIQNALDESNVGVLTQDALLRHTPNIMTHTTIADKVVIPYGWNENRLIYLLSYTEPIPGGVKLVFIQGYTDYYEKSYSGKLDPNTKFYFDTIIELSDITNRLGHRIVKVTNAFKTVYNPVSNNAYMEQNNELMDNLNSDLEVLRPADIALNITNSVNELGDTFLANTKYDNTLKAVDVNDELGTQLVTNVINKYRDTVDDVSSFTDMNTQLNAISSLSGVSPYTISLLGIIKMMRSMETNIDGDITYATLSELEYIFPDLFSPNKSQIIEAVNPNDSLLRVRNHLSSGEVDLNTRETRIHAIASEFGVGLNTIMLKYTITKLSIVLSNYYVEGLEHFSPTPYYFLVLDAKSIIPNLIPEKSIRNMLQDIMINLMPSITSNNLIDTHIVATMDMFGVSYIEIELDGEEPVIIPFSDAVSSLYTPSIIDSHQANTELNKFETIVRETIE